MAEVVWQRIHGTQRPCVRTVMDANNHWHSRIIQAVPSPSEPYLRLASLPAELRLKIWSHATEPRTALLHDLITRPRAYAIPPVTQVSSETRLACHRGYQRAGKGSYFHFSRDILVCDYLIVDDARDDPILQDLAPKVQRLVFWDCVPDDGKVADPTTYSQNLQHSFNRKIADRIEFDKLLFPNLKEMWVVKIGRVEPTWGIQRDPSACPAEQRRQAARHLRYWVNEAIIEMAPMNPEDPDTKLILEEGRCRVDNCQDVNHDRPITVTRVAFMDGCYANRERRDAQNNEWLRLRGDEADDDETERPEDEKAANEERRLRWALAERVLMFPLRWDDADDGEESPKNRGRSPLLDARDVA